MERAWWWVTAIGVTCVVLITAGCAEAGDGSDGSSDTGQPGLTGMMPGVTPMGTGGVVSMGTGGMVGVGAPGMAPVGTGGAPGMTGVAGSGTLPGTGGTSAMMGTGGTGVMTGTGGMGTMTGTGGMEALPHEDLGQGDGQDVITIGDSWMNLILTGIEQSLERISMRNYRNYAVPGTLVLNEQIPGQYASAKAADPDIKTVVMTGGGNDILTSPCADAACEPIVDDVSQRLTELMMQMGTDGVEDVVLIGYTYPSNMSKHASLDYSIMLSQTSCVTTTVPRCHFIDSTMLAITLADGIHPNAAGYDLIGRTVWELMQAEGIRR